MTGEAEDYESLCTLPSYEVTNTSWSNKLDKKDPRSRTKAVWELTVGWKTVRALLGWACTASLAWAGGGCIIILWQEPANISKNLQFILEKIKKLALAYTALHTTHAQRIQILRNKIVNAQDPSKYLLYCHTLYNAMAWSDIGDNARALSTHVPGSALSKDDVMGWGEMSWGWLCVDNYASGAGTDWAGVIFYTWVAQIHFHWQTWTVNTDTARRLAPVHSGQQVMVTHSVCLAHPAAGRKIKQRMENTPLIIMSRL